MKNETSPSRWNCLQPPIRARSTNIGLPSNPSAPALRARFRAQLGDAVRRVVAGEQLPDVTATAHIPAEDQQEFINTVRAELTHLEVWNCARFRLPIPEVERWIAAGRPGA